MSLYITILEVYELWQQQKQQQQPIIFTVMAFEKELNSALPLFTRDRVQNNFYVSFLESNFLALKVKTEAHSDPLKI